MAIVLMAFAAAAAVLALVPALYLCLISLLALAPPRPRNSVPDRQRHFTIIVPAHDEERDLPVVLADLQRLDYPRSLIRTVVIADNCSDRTAELAAKMGAEVMMRRSPDRRGKGAALAFAVPLVLADTATDAIVIIDADSRVSSDLLGAMNGALSDGVEAVQARYTVSDPGASFSAAVRALAFAAMHIVRPRGLARLGASTPLFGNGMAFSRRLALSHPWLATLAEDLDYFGSLSLSGEPVGFVGEAGVATLMPDTLQGAEAQTDRWDSGRFAAALRYGPRLAARAARVRSLACCLAGVEIAMPPLSMLAALSGLALMLSIAAEAPIVAAIAFAAIASLAIHVAVALRFAELPGQALVLLLGAPVYIVWKITRLIRLVVVRRTITWSRTARD
jgi:cellulose synthase/poly-beta-1,6-N-acetylglucosamine synthase-like glycosyltransferase